MTWVVTPPANDTEADERVHAVAAFAAGSLDAFWKVQAVINEVIEHAGETEDVSELVELEQEVLAMRDQLIAIFKIHKALLPKSTVDDLREGFKLANIHDLDARKKVIEDFFDREVDRIQELSPEDAKALQAHLVTLEEPF
jgi:hypothetical protein